MRKGYQAPRCTVCGVTRSETRISTRGKCKRCAVQAQLDNVDGIEARSGLAYQRWRLGIVLSQLPGDVVASIYKAGLFDSEPV
jgi:hypothetical protein